MSASTDGATAGLDDVLITAELAGRAARAPDYEGEAKALAALAQAMAASPETVLQKLVDTALALCRAESAGMSLLEPGGEHGVFRWHAIAGVFAPALGRAMPREASPCGTVLDRDATLLFAYPERHFPFPTVIDSPMAETLLVPFHVAGRPVGTVWAITHTPGKRFDAEDARLLTSLAQFAAVAYQMTTARRAETAARAGLEASERRLEQELADARTLQRISTELISEQRPDALYAQLLGAAMALMRSDAASVQMLDPGGTHLQLLASRNFHPESAAFWQRVEGGSGSSCGEALKRGTRVVVPDSEASEFMRGTRNLEEYRRSGLRAVISIPLVARDGRPIGMLSTHWRAVHQPEERDFVFFDALARQAADLIERARAEAALRAADRAKDEFLAMLGHELRNPLTPLRNVVEALRRYGLEGEALGRAYAMMGRQVAHLTRLVDDLLDVSRITRGLVELRKEPVDLAEVARQAVEMVTPALEGRGHDLSVALPRQPLSVTGDATRLTQVIANLLHNAAKYTDPGGKIWLSVERVDGQALVRVRDNGSGMRAELIPKVFDLFAQGERTLDHSQGGLGLGLALVKRLVELHGGTAEARSDGPGQGSEFVVRLPPSEEEGGGRQHERDGAPAANSSFNLPSLSLKVLVVDDNEDVAESLLWMLDGLAKEVKMVHSGRAAIEAAGQWRPDVILCDLGMLGMDGYETCRRLRQLPGLGNAVIAAVSGYGDEADRCKSREAGFDRHLVKPIGRDALEELVRSAAATR